MLDHISIENLRTLVVQEATRDKAEATQKYLEEITKLVDNKWLASKYVLSIEGSKVLIRQDSGIQSLPIALHMMKAISENKFLSLNTEIHRLEKEEEQEKRAQKNVGFTNMHAKEKSGLRAFAAKNQVVSKTNSKLEALLAEQRTLSKH
jgi:hypothetical protein